MDNSGANTMPIAPQNSPKTPKTPKRVKSSKYFNWRHKLERSPCKQEMVILLGGLFINLHLLTALFLLSESLPTQSINPLLVLCIEIMVSCALVIGYILHEVSRTKKILSSWKRSALGRLLRNFVVSLLVSISCILALKKLETQNGTIVLESLGSVMVPILALLMMNVLKIALIKDKNSLLKLVYSLLFLAQIILWVVHHDYLDLPWLGLCAPVLFTLALSLSLVFLNVHESWYQNSPLSFFLGLFQLIGFLLAFVSVCFCVAISQQQIQFTGIHLIMLWITALCLCVGFYRTFGEFVIDILFGHAEVDYYHCLIPARSIRRYNRNSNYDSTSIYIPLIG